MSSLKNPSPLEHVVEFGCGLRAKVNMFGNPDESRNVTVDISTQTCFECRYKCVNVEGHRGKIRTGGQYNKHVIVACPARVISRLSPEVESHIVMKFAKANWPNLANVYYLEPSVYEVLNADGVAIGYVFFAGADAKWLSEKKAKFMRS
jgi:hypothetical protein